MIEPAEPDLARLQPGPERRAMMREMDPSIRPDDFSDAERLEIQTEAPGMCAELQAVLDHPDHGQRSVVSESVWVTHREAARILGVHVSLIRKMLSLGDLTARRQRPSLLRAQVVELAAARERASVDREKGRTTPPPGPRPPDEEHEWLLVPAAAAVLGCSVVTMNARARGGRAPSTLLLGRRWFRLDHLELMVRAEVAARRRQSSSPAPSSSVPTTTKSSSS